MNFRARAITVALYADDTIAFDRRCRSIFSAEQQARWLAGVACKGGRSPDRSVADWRPPLLKIRRSAKLERTAGFAGSGGEFISLPARTRRTQSRCHRC